MNIQEIERREGRLLATIKAFKKKYGDEVLKDSGLDEQTMFALVVRMPEFVDSWITIAETRIKIAELLEPQGGVSKEIELGALVKKAVEDNQVMVSLWIVDRYSLDTLVTDLMTKILVHRRFYELVNRGIRTEIVLLVEKSIRETLASSKAVFEA